MFEPDALERLIDELVAQHGHRSRIARYIHAHFFAAAH
jgi:hypothetical protein